MVNALVSRHRYRKCGLRSRRSNCCFGRGWVARRLRKRFDRRGCLRVSRRSKRWAGTTCSRCSWRPTSMRSPRSSGRVARPSCARSWPPSPTVNATRCARLSASKSSPNRRDALLRLDHTGQLENHRLEDFKRRRWRFLFSSQRPYGRVGQIHEGNGHSLDRIDGEELTTDYSCMCGEFNTVVVGV